MSYIVSATKEKYVGKHKFGKVLHLTYLQFWIKISIGILKEPTSLLAKTQGDVIVRC